LINGDLVSKPLEDEMVLFGLFFLTLTIVSTLYLT
jgi:hypothetical protein